VAFGTKFPSQGCPCRRGRFVAQGLLGRKTRGRTTECSPSLHVNAVEIEGRTLNLHFVEV